MDYFFRECTKTPEDFFAVLPADWRESIEPYWPDYRNSAHIFILQSQEEIVGGGIVFSTVSPDTQIYRQEAQRWFDLGYRYIAFLWIGEEYRGQHLGSLWLKELRSHFPGQKFWLSIEDYELAAFYQRNGFRVIKEIDGAYGKEWILTD